MAIAIEVPRELRAQMVSSLEKYFEVERQERIGNIAAGALLGYFLEEIEPTLYNRGLANAQERMQQRVLDLDIDVHEDEFGYWQERDVAARRKR